MENGHFDIESVAQNTRERLQRDVMMRKKGFTLIELLVVISIIALLLSILMPSLNATKKKVRDVVCMSNLKQWGITYLLYTNDHNGRNAYANWFAPNIQFNSFTEVLRPYYENVNDFRLCPSAIKVRSGVDTSGTTTSIGLEDAAWYMGNQPWMAPDDWGIGSYGESIYRRPWMKAG